ncbi:hypothetical protein Q5H80_16680 [Vibrio sp. SNU_ST1]|uniref:hypothetical protein n=1 Tax=Vibrio sp. SNU_ST1 TaxID=3064001 RepID=UPI00272B9185|nr:hypothetical protein [Vibrio sp. SNU_ST1]WKY60472.1 hypothetical protein Q5H80_16680 [Vibrio sp. SNU_ST1]
MKQLKIGLFILMCGVGVLLALTYFPMTSSTGERIEATVISNTLTQSLDGHRRYLTVEMSDNELSEKNKTETFRVSIPPTTDCPIDSIVVLDTLTNQITEQNSYQFIHCRTAQ